MVIAALGKLAALRGFGTAIFKAKRVNGALFQSFVSNSGNRAYRIATKDGKTITVGINNLGKLIRRNTQTPVPPAKTSLNRLGHEYDAGYKKIVGHEANVFDFRTGKETVISSSKTFEYHFDDYYLNKAYQYVKNYVKNTKSWFADVSRKSGDTAHITGINVGTNGSGKRVAKIIYQGDIKIKN